MKYPSITEVIAPDQEEVSFWWTFLPDPRFSRQAVLEGERAGDREAEL
jgi:hypothetical protein